MQKGDPGRLSIVDENADRTGQSLMMRRWCRTPHYGPLGRRSMKRTLLVQLHRTAMDGVSSKQNILSILALDPGCNVNVRTTGTESCAKEDWEEFNPAYLPRTLYSSEFSKLAKPPSNACSWNEAINCGEMEILYKTDRTGRPPKEGRTSKKMRGGMTR